MLEIDTPGHTSAISKAHPEHIACAEATPWATYANGAPASCCYETNWLTPGSVRAARRPAASRF